MLIMYCRLITYWLARSMLTHFRRSYPTCCPLVRFSHIGEGASKMLRATGHASMVKAQRKFETQKKFETRIARQVSCIDLFLAELICLIHHGVMRKQYSRDDAWVDGRCAPSRIFRNSALRLKCLYAARYSNQSPSRAPPAATKGACRAHSVRKHLVR